MFKANNRLKISKSEEKGFTLVELLAVIVILGIIAAIAVPAVFGIIEKSREDVCYTNRSELARMYKSYLDIESKKDTKENFDVYLLDSGYGICPSDGVISYDDGVIKCNIHFDDSGENGEQDDGNQDVPFL